VSGYKLSNPEARINESAKTKKDTVSREGQGCRMGANRITNVFRDTITVADMQYLHDNDASFQPLDKVFKSEGVKIVKTPFLSPDC
jgi:hypothetical protein